MKNGTEIAKFANAEFGIESKVVTGSHGFHVTLRDTDADEFVPMVKCFKNEGDARQYAEFLVA